MALLALGDLLCGFAKSPAQLYVFRGIAGVGAGGINSLVMIIFSDMTTLQQRGKYQGLLESNIALGNGVGPLIGGVFAESSATWRWTFWYVVPVTIFAAVVIFLTLPVSKTEGRAIDKVKMIDYWGMVLSLAGVIFLLVSGTLNFLNIYQCSRNNLDPYLKRWKHICLELTSCHLLPHNWMPSFSDFRLR
jgi:MFS family permease